MARGYLIPPEVEALIVAVHHNKPTWKPREVWMVARNILHERAAKNPKKYPDLPRKLKTGWPSLSSVRKIIKEDKLPREENGARKTIPSKDDPWSIATLSDPNYFIPPEAMPAVMAFYKERLAKDDVLTIREALWAARLYKIVEPLDLLFDWAFLYAIDEMVVEAHGEGYKSNRNDLELIETPQVARETMREIHIWQIAVKYKADPMQLKELDLSMEETEEAAKTGKYKWDRWNELEVQNERKHKAEEQE